MFAIMINEEIINDNIVPKDLYDFILIFLIHITPMHVRFVFVLVNQHFLNPFLDGIVLAITNFFALFVDCCHVVSFHKLYELVHVVPQSIDERLLIETGL